MIFFDVFTLLLIPKCMFTLIYMMVINFVFCAHVRYGVQKKIIDDTRSNSHHIFIKFIL